MIKMLLPILYLILFDSYNYIHLQNPKEEITIEDFEKVKHFILQYGNRKTYCNRYNCNPHFDFGEFDAYLDPIDSYYIGGNTASKKEAGFFKRLTLVKQTTYLQVEINSDNTTVQLTEGNKEQFRSYFKKMLSIATSIDTTLIEMNRKATGPFICK